MNRAHRMLSACAALAVAATLYAAPSAGAAPSASAAVAGVDGFASLNGGTTGGQGGTTVTVTTASALTNAAKATGKSIIRVSGLIALSSTVKVASDKTIVGVGAASGITGKGLDIKGVRNVIVQNLKISKVVGGDAISIQKSTNIWIDHNEIFSDLTHGIDYYDGAIDITHAADYITVSWNHIHDHSKMILIGHSDGNSAEDTGKFHVTLHHNMFQNYFERGPSLRFGTGHVYNNYYVKGEYGAYSRVNAQMLAQNNVFRSVPLPITTDRYSKVHGYVNESGNDLGGGRNSITQVGTFTRAPYAYQLDATNTVIAKVQAGAGTGKI